ncbi:hypothetical protein CEXT_584101 [Caerostris extrusa]|uniref:ATP-dependent DNA helicase n=1 Tax=Caerostris extrusa TaxID=172846 RepID=A0AAV4UBF0_CAEEX|nr:hypothetical protein CEXT_584101 [Caerostris extrusa]
MKTTNKNDLIQRDPVVCSLYFKHKVDYNIPFKLGAKYMLTCNLNTSDKLVNGAAGLLRKVETCTMKGVAKLGIKRIWPEFMEGPKSASKHVQSLFDT